jgi:hypothetical protein
MMTQDVDHKKVTKRAWSAAMDRGGEYLNMKQGCISETVSLVALTKRSLRAKC